MRKIEELFSSIAYRPRVAVLWGAVLFLAFLSCGCAVKKTVKVDVPQAIREAKTASFERVLAIIRSYDKITSLSTDPTGMELALTSTRKIDLGEIEKYPSLRGYILLRRPDSVRIVLLMPVAQSRLFDILSVGDNLSLLYVRGHEFFEGKNSGKDLVATDPSTGKEINVPPMRGPHIFEALFPQSIDLTAPDIRLDLVEERDAQASYYVLTVLQEEAARTERPPRIHTLRKIYIERFGLTIARQKVFDREGRILSDITYSYPKQVRVEGIDLPERIHIDRPMDGYTLDLKFRKWNINPDLPDEAFVLHPGPEDRVVPLVEKGILK